MADREQRRHAGTVSLAVIRAMIDDATKHDYGPARRDASTVLGVYADPGSLEGTRIEHDGVSVTVVPCVSALAMREALLSRDPAGWLVVVTDRPEEDLGVGLLAHLAGHKLRTPDPWEAVRQQFAATGLEPSLYAEATSRPLAHGLLLARPEAGWPPAPAGALTRDHALGSVAREWLGLPRRSLDALGVLQWTASPGLAGRIADLRALAGDELTDATVQWICGSAGAAGAPLGHLLRRGEIRDALPLGVVLGLLTGPEEAESPSDDEQLRTGELSLAKLAHRWDNPTPEPAALGALGSAATQVISDLVRDRRRADQARQLLTKADQLLDEVGAPELAVHSELLPSGLTARLREVAHHVRAAMTGTGAGAGVDPGRATRHTSDIEDAWVAACRHLLADSSGAGAGDPRLGPMNGAVRLSRWLAQEAPDPTPSLAGLALRQATTDAWVDAAVNDTHEGVADPELAEALTRVLTTVRDVRDQHDREFAAALARSTRDDEGTPEGYLPEDGEQVWLLEHLMARVVVPLAKQTPTLLLVMDGMSTGVATEIVHDVLARRQGWQEALLPGASVRGAALAVLPSLTEVSRASLLCGELTTGGQGKEQQGYGALTAALGLGDHPSLFHKKPLDTSRPGFAVADDVAHAIADEDQKLVTCVLNTIDDALDRSDPAGTAWTADAVKHLRPLLDRAFAAGRTVVMTADHGHVVERRVGTTRAYKDMTSGRSRPATQPAGDDEVLVTGSRVLPDGSAVLPVNERLRYGPLKAGYHGGASPAEVVVPVVVLVPGDDPPAGTGLSLAPPQAPAWWDRAPAGEAARVEVEIPTARRPRTASKPAYEGVGLFDQNLVGPPAPAHQPTHTLRLGDAVTGAEVYQAQRAVSGRIALTDDQVTKVLETLSGTPGTRLTTAALASVLAVPSSRARGAVAQLQLLLNVEGYPVLRTEGAVVILDEPMLREQFGIR